MLLAALWIVPFYSVEAQELQKLTLGYSGTGITQYTLEIAKRQGRGFLEGPMRGTSRVKRTCEFS